MKSITSIKRAIAVILAAIMILLVGCTTAPAGNTDPANNGKKHDLSFVIIDDTNWDKEVTLGSYSYTIHVNLLADGKLELVGTCTGEAMAAGGGGNGGSGSDEAATDATAATDSCAGGETTPATEAPAATEAPDATTATDSSAGGETTPATEAPAATEGTTGDSEGGEQGGTAETTPATTKPAMTDEEKKAQSFTQSGTWVYEKGLGYTLTINGVTTKTNYEKESARTYFFFDVKNGTDADGNEISTGVIQFAAKDTGFRADMGEDYTRWEDRDAEVAFFAAQTNTGNNPNSTRLWVLPNGEAASLVYSGSSYTYKYGTWVKNEDGTISIDIGGSVVTCDHASANGKDAYRVTYNSMTMFSAGSTIEDFDGAVVKTLTTATGDYTLEMTSKGIARFKTAEGAEKATGTYTEEAGVLTVVFNGTTYTSEGNTITISMSITSGTDSSATTETVEATFNLG